MRQVDGSPVRLPDGRTGRWWRVGRDEPRAMWPARDWVHQDRRQYDCGWWVCAAPRLDQIDQDAGRFG